MSVKVTAEGKQPGGLPSTPDWHPETRGQGQVGHPAAGVEPSTSSSPAQGLSFSISKMKELDKTNRFKFLNNNLL